MQKELKSKICRPVRIDKYFHMNREPNDQLTSKKGVYEGVLPLVLPSLQHYLGSFHYLKSCFSESTNRERLAAVWWLETMEY